MNISNGIMKGRFMMHKTLLLILISVWINYNSVHSQIVKDIDGNIYEILTIGRQTWMAENLKTTRFNDGVVIPQIKDAVKWKRSASPAYCWLYNDIGNKEIYGALYNWYTVNTKKVCPTGWHVSTKEDWIVLISFVGDENIAGAKLKEKGTAHWKNSVSLSTNEVGFTALPGGLRAQEGHFPEFSNSFAVWWTATEFSQTDAWNRGLYYSSNKIFGGYDNKRNGFSIRCVKD